MENTMNCFQFKSYLFDWLNRSADQQTFKMLENHLQQCRQCHTLMTHHQVILSLIESQPLSTLPESLKKEPFSTALPRLTSMPFSLSRWQRIPWYVRVLLESGLIVLGVITLVSSTPKLREIYENQIEKNFKNLEDHSPVLEELSLQEKQVTQNQELNEQSSELKAQEDELNGEDESVDSLPSSSGAQLWRFTLKTVTPDELRVEIIKVLGQFQLTTKNTASLGIQVPGGIEFNFLFPSEQIPELKKKLEALTPKSTQNQQDSEHPSGQEAFTWYRVQSKKKLPSGKAQVIIWLSQPHIGG